MMNTITGLDIDSNYTITPEQIEFYRTNGFIKLKQVLSPEALAYYGREISSKVQELNRQSTPLEQRSTYGKAFLQVGNIWKHSEIAREFVMGKRLGRIAAELMEVTGVRLYHDQALYKEPGGGITPWHADQYYWPVSTDKTITVWIPLQAIPQHMGPLAFSPGSQNLKFGRDLEIGDESEIKLSEALKSIPIVDEPFDLGEVSFHGGWTFHRAGGNSSDRPREVMTIIYMDEEMRLASPKNNNQRQDWEAWCKGVEVGAVINSPLNPVIWSCRN